MRPLREARGQLDTRINCVIIELTNGTKAATDENRPERQLVCLLHLVRLDREGLRATNDIMFVL